MLVISIFRIGTRHVIVLLSMSSFWENTVVCTRKWALCQHSLFLKWVQVAFCVSWLIPKASVLMQRARTCCIPTFIYDDVLWTTWNRFKHCNLLWVHAIQNSCGYTVLFSFSYESLLRAMFLTIVSVPLISVEVFSAAISSLHAVMRITDFVMMDCFAFCLLFIVLVGHLLSFGLD